MRSRQPAPVGERRTPLTWARDFIDCIAEATPARFAIVVFTGLILITTVPLSLPMASRDGTVTPLADALFTAVSTICVTGG